MTVSRSEKLRAVADAHASWVNRHLGPVSSQFDPARFGQGSEYQLHHVDVDADGAAEDEFAAEVERLLSASPAKGAPGNRGRSLSAEFDPDQARDEKGRWTRHGALRRAVVGLVPDGDREHITRDYGLASFAARDGASPGRHIEWERSDSDGFRLYLNPGGDGENPSLELPQGQLDDLTSQIGAMLLRENVPPLDPNDRQSVLLHSVLDLHGLGAAFTTEDGSYIDISPSADGYVLEFQGEEDDEPIQVDLSRSEVEQLHAAMLLTVTSPIERPPQNLSTDPIRGRRRARMRNRSHQSLPQGGGVR